MKVFFSNRVEKLYERLKGSLFHNTQPFSRRLVVVSTQSVKSWLMLAMAKDPDLGVGAGFEIAYLEEAIDKFSRAAKIPSQTELALSIEAEIRRLIEESQEELWKPLFSYIGKLTRKGERRLIALSDSLARLFLQYGLFGARMITRWDSSWQAELWRLVHAKRSWSYSAQALEEADLRQDVHYDVHLFSLSFLSRAHVSFFTRAARSIPVHFYMLSPCQSFWSDLHKGEGNPLLAHFGRLGREMAKCFEDSDSETDYVIPEVALENACYSELVFDDLDLEEGPLTLLKAIQTDMLLLREPTEPIALPADDSIQVHAAVSRRREVEILYDRLLHALDQGVEPKDIIVMAPKIMDYEPYIHSIFGAGEQRVPYHLLDSKFLSESLLVQGFLHLLRIPSGRWDAASIMQLFSFPAFQKSRQMTGEDVQVLKDLLIEVGVNWGEDAAHRDEMLRHDHAQEAKSSSAGTWEHGIGRLVENLAVSDGQTPLLEASQGVLLGRFLELIHSMRKTLRPLTDGTRLSWKAWSDYLHDLLQTYFGIDEEVQKDDEARGLWSALSRLRRAGRSFPDDMFTFNTVRRHLESCLDKEDLHAGESQLNAISFCSMLPMRAIPAQVICLLGMDESAFPRTEPKQSLDVLNGRPDADYRPTQMDYDRFLFLEALLSARKQLYLSYVYVENSKERPCSTLVSELLSYITSSYALNVEVYKHPFQAFDKSYFNTEARYQGYSRRNYGRALAFYGTQKKNPHRFIPEFTSYEPAEVPTETTVDLRQLAAFARNPLKTYFNQMGIYFSEDEELKSEEAFMLSRLDLSILKKEALGKGLEEIVLQADKKGLLPGGTFREFAIGKLTEGVAELEENLAACGVSPQEIFQVHLTESCDSPLMLENGDWEVPALKLHSVTIVGTLTDVSKKGLIFHGKNDKAHILKTWPQFLVFLCVRHYFSAEEQLLLAKNGKAKSPWFSDPKPELERYVDYYLQARHQVSPLLPEWTHDLIHLEGPALQEKIRGSLTNDFNPIYNDYLIWMANGTDIPIASEWKTRGIDLFAPLYDAWYKKASRKT